MTKLYAYAVGALLAVIVGGGAACYISSLRDDVKAAQDGLTLAQASVTSCGAALTQADKATADALQQAKLYHDQAQAVIDSTKTQKGKNTAAGAVFATKLTTSSKTADCQSVLEAQLCPALSGY